MRISGVKISGNAHKYLQMENNVYIILGIKKLVLNSKIINMKVNNETTVSRNESQWRTQSFITPPSILKPTPLQAPKIRHGKQT